MLVYIFNNIFNLIKKMKTEQIALLSILVTFIIFIFNRQSELKYKKYEDKKQQYSKLIEMLKMIYSDSKLKENGQIKLTEKLKKQFFDVGSSLLLYGSKKLYRQYVFFREFSSNPIITKSIYYDESELLYLMAKILVIIRKEVGISNFNNITQNEALAFFVNEVANNPEQKIKESIINYKIRMLKLEMFFIDRTKFVFTKRVYNFMVRPVGGVIKILFKHMQ